MKKNIVLFLSIVSISLRAELLILKKTSEGLAALTREESLQYGPTISQIILKYQWPMCTSSNLTKAEQDALLTPGIQNAEEIFIQKKLQEAIPGLDIQVAFVPTTLYELFCIFYYFKNSKRSAVAIKENSINYEDNPFDRIGLTLVAQCQIFLEKLTGKTQSYFRMLKNSDNLRDVFDIVNITKDQVFRKYLDVNQLFFDTQVKISFDDLSDLPLFTEDDESAYLYVNNEFVRYCLQFPFLQGQIDGMALSEAIRSCKQDLTDQIKKDFPLTITRLEQMYMTNIRDFWMIPSLYDDKDSWISLMIDFDYEAKLQNKAFLLRGSSFYEDYVKHDQKVIKKTMAGSTMRYVNFTDMFNQEKLYSVSFGQSLFAGFMLENSGIGACVYWYLTNKKQGYLLWVDKKEYVKSQNDSLFFISPLSTIAGLFGDGEFFHARTKIPLSKNLIQELQSNKLIDVDGLVYQLPFDYSGLLMVQRDPLNQAILFSDYIAKNGVFLNEYRPKLKNLETAQKEASRLYKDVKLVKSKLINWIDKYRNSKKAEEVSVIQ
jgi:hypothetical protein